jgi:hypothetical protein
MARAFLLHPKANVPALPGFTGMQNLQRRGASELEHTRPPKGGRYKTNCRSQLKPSYVALYWGRCLIRAAAPSGPQTTRSVRMENIAVNSKYE